MNFSIIKTIVSIATFILLLQGCGQNNEPYVEKRNTSYQLTKQHEFQVDQIAYPNNFKVRNDTLWILDAQLGKIKALDIQGKLLFEFGKMGDGPGEFSHTTGHFQKRAEKALTLSLQQHKERCFLHTCANLVNCTQNTVLGL